MMAVDDDGGEPRPEIGDARGSFGWRELVGLGIDDRHGIALRADERRDETRPDGILDGGQGRAERLIDLRPAAGIDEDEIERG